MHITIKRKLFNSNQDQPACMHGAQPSHHLPLVITAIYFIYKTVYYVVRNAITVFILFNVQSNSSRPIITHLRLCAQGYLAFLLTTFSLWIDGQTAAPTTVSAVFNFQQDEIVIADHYSNIAKNPLPLTGLSPHFTSRPGWLKRTLRRYLQNYIQ